MKDSWDDCDAVTQSMILTLDQIMIQEEMTREEELAKWIAGGRM